MDYCVLVGWFVYYLLCFGGSCSSRSWFVFYGLKVCGFLLVRLVIVVAGFVVFT